ncbi:MAG: DUF2306 domain-containing protein [Rubrivivax sp.]
MNLSDTWSHLSPAVAWHLVTAIAALLLGPLALWLPKGAPGHRIAGRVWLVAMLGAAISSFFIHGRHLPHVAGFGPIHLLSVAALVGIGLGLWHILRRNVQRHRRVMRFTYGAVVVAGLMTLLPQRLLGSSLLAVLS